MPRLTKVKLAERRAEEWDLYVQGWTQPQIAQRYGLDQSTVSDDLRLYREAFPPETREQRIAAHQAGLAWATRRLRELAELPAPPVTAGKDGFVVRDPDTDAIVRDYGLQRQAALDLVRLQEREAKLLGLNAADKVEVSGSVTFEGSVDAELQELADQLGLQGPVLPPSFAADEVSEGVRGSDADASA
jgi:hypothetical protein